MAKLTLLIGLPASGKSTLAQEMLEKSGNSIRINKDLLRTMLHFDKWSGRNEGLTQVASTTLAKQFLIAGKSVIIDDTNLNPNTIAAWQGLVSSVPTAKLEIVKLDTPWQECIERDRKREKRVGDAVIKNMALRYGLVERPLKGYVLCDIDGTIADTRHRLHFVQGEKKDWKGFFSQMHLDPVRAETFKIINDLCAEGYTLIFVSARPENYRDVTEQWLAENVGIKYFTLIMRKAGDKRDDDIVKKELLDAFFPDRSLIYKVIDDRPRVIRMWRDNGLEVVDVGNGIDF